MYCICLGDLNARIGLEVPNISFSGNACNIGRSSADGEINELGRTFLRLCSTTSIVSLNGLKHVDDDVYDHSSFYDSHTYYCRKRGIEASVIDYVCVNLTFLPLVHDLTQVDRKGHSDHFPLICRLGKPPPVCEPQTVSTVRIG